MKTFSLFKGVFIGDDKKYTRNFPVSELAEPESFCVPVIQHSGPPSKIMLEVGDRVKEGELIAKSGGKNSSNIFAPCSGKVTDISIKETTSGKTCYHITIKNDFKTEGNTQFLKPLVKFEPASIIKRINEAGVVGISGTSTHSKILYKIKRPASIIINACESEPYITADEVLVSLKSEEVIEGAKLLAKAVETNRIIVVIQKTKTSSYNALNKYIKENAAQNSGFVISLETVSYKYPAGDTPQLIKALTDYEIPSYKKAGDLGYMIFNVQTAFAVYQACYLGIPYYKKVVTVVGRNAEKQQNYIIKTGTSFKHIFDQINITNDQRLVKIIEGGPMRGVCVNNLNQSVTKTTTGVLIMDSSEISAHKETACIRCGKCTNVCPMNIVPMQIDKFAVENNLKMAKKYGAAFCSGCGCCGYVCPAKRYLVQRIVNVRNIINSKRI